MIMLPLTYPMVVSIIWTDHYRKRKKYFDSLWSLASCVFVFLCVYLLFLSIKWMSHIWLGKREVNYDGITWNKSVWMVSQMVSESQ